MAPRLRLQEIERRAWARTFEHGLWDIGIGLLLASFGATIFTGFYWLSPIWVAALVPSMKDLARRLIVPRIGHVTFKSRRQQSKNRIQALLGGLVVVGAVMFLLTFWATQSSTAPAWIGWIHSHFLTVLGLVWGGALAVVAWAADFPRLYAHAGLLFGTLLATELITGIHLGIALISVGGVIALVGVVLLLRFLVRYPRHSENPVDPGRATDSPDPEGECDGKT